MVRYVFLLLSLLNAFTFACSHKEAGVTSPPPKKIVGGISSVNKDEMNDEMFQQALTEVIRRLDDANKCYSFKLVRVIDATKQVVAGMKYVMRLEVSPVYSGENDEECLDLCESGLDGSKEVAASIVLRFWDEPKYHIQFNPNNDHPTDFNGDGSLILACKLPKWTNMSPEELQANEFQKVVHSCIDKLNHGAEKCFRYELMDVLDGKKKQSHRTEYKWNMKVKKIYDESMPDCSGACADDCSGVMIFAGNALVSPQENRQPELSYATCKEPINM